MRKKAKKTKMELKPGMRVKMALPDLATLLVKLHRPKLEVPARWKVGQQGTLMENDFPKYDYKVRFDSGYTMYFFEDEVEAVTGEKDNG